MTTGIPFGTNDYPVYSKVGGMTTATEATIMYVLTGEEIMFPLNERDKVSTVM
jgi:hypothetical protein